MTNRDKITELLQAFSCIYSNQDRIIFEQQLISLLPELSENERKFLFGKMMSSILDTVQSIGNDFTEVQLKQMERILSLKDFNIAA